MKLIALLAFITLIVPIHIGTAATTLSTDAEVHAEITTHIETKKAEVAALHASISPQGPTRVLVVIDARTVVNKVTSSPLEALDACNIQNISTVGFYESFYCYYGNEVIFAQVY